MIKWINFLHIYQPPYQDAEVVERVSKESYWSLVKTLQAHPKTKITLNFSGCLLEHLFKIGQSELIEQFKKLLASGQIELVGSAMYHPILPLLPASEIIRQIRLNDEILKKAFGNLYKPSGFFLPEMAYSPQIARIVKKLGFQWIILDEMSYNGKLGSVAYNQKYKIKNVGLQVVFRNRSFSKTFPPKTITTLIRKSNPPAFAITATDGEMYGHHHVDWEHVFDNVLKNPLVKTITVSEYLASLPKRYEKINPVSSSWETSEKDVQNKIPFALWNNPQNKIHHLLWNLRKIAIRVISQTKERGINYDYARNHLDRGLASCAWWWASDRELEIFNFITWNPDTIEKGIKELISSIRSLTSVSPQQKLKAEKIYHQLVREIWKKHWSKHEKEQKNKQVVTVNKIALKLLDPNFIATFFEKKLKKQIGTKKIDYIGIKTFKDKIRPTFHHIVARYTVHFKNKRFKPLDIYCSSHSHESREGAYDALSYVHPRGFNEGHLLSPTPLFYEKSMNAFFYLGPQGKNLYQLISKKKSSSSQIRLVIALTAQWLAKLHSIPINKAKNFNPLQTKVSTFIPGPKHMLDAIKRKHRKYPNYYRETKALYEKINTLEKKLTRKKRSVIHGDIHPENVIYNTRHKDTLYVIDYTDCCLAEFTRDIANFLQQLGYMTRDTYGKLKIASLQKFFLKEYHKARGVKKFSQQDANLLLMYQAWTALRSAMFFLTVTTFDRPRADQLFLEAKRYLGKIKI